MLYWPISRMLNKVPEQNLKEEHYEFGPFRVDVAERVLTKGQQVIPLTPKAFDTLVVLVRNGGHVVEKDAVAQGSVARHVC